MDDISVLGIFLHQIGVSSKYNGFEYIILSIIILLQENSICSMQELYMKIAAIKNCTSYMVERNIRTCIEKSWYKMSYETITKVFGETLNYELDKPSNKEFILNLFDYYRFNCKL